MATPSTQALKPAALRAELQGLRQRLAFLEQRHQKLQARNTALVLERRAVEARLHDYEHPFVEDPMSTAQLLITAPSSAIAVMHLRQVTATDPARFTLTTSYQGATTEEVQALEHAAATVLRAMHDTETVTLESLITLATGLLEEAGCVVTRVVSPP